MPVSLYSPFLPRKTLLSAHRMAPGLQFSGPKFSQPRLVQPQFSGIGLRYDALKKREPIAPQQPATPSATPEPRLAETVTPKLFSPAQPAQNFRINCGGNETLVHPLSLQEVLKAVTASAQEAGHTPVELLAASKGLKALPSHPVIIEDTGTPQQIRAILMQDPASNKRLTWADFHNTPDHPLLTRLSEKFSFIRFRDRTDDKSEISFELPAIDDDNIQLTVYGMEYGADHIQKTGKTLHLYLGDTFLVTTRQQPWTSLDEEFETLKSARQYVSPQDMMVYILDTVINRYGAVITSLEKDFSTLDRKIAGKRPDETFLPNEDILKDALELGQKISQLFETVVQQKLVLQELLTKSRQKHSTMVPQEEIKELLVKLEQHVLTLEHYQERKNGQVAMFQAQLSNALAQNSNNANEVMKVIAAFTILSVPYTVIGSLIGMNVPIPFQNKQSTFYWLLGIATGATGSIFAYLKKKNWL